jgi:hypothetical protein
MPKEGPNKDDADPNDADDHNEYGDMVSRRQAQIDAIENEQRIAMGIPPKKKAPPPPKK